MNAKTGKTGQCLCGKVKFRLTDEVHEVGACHCDMCRRWGGGPFLEIRCMGPVEFEGEEHIVRYRSSDWAERGFCGVCGSNLFYCIVPDGPYMMSVGALEDQTGLKFTSQVFIDEKPDWYAFANKTKNMTGAELFAMYAPQDGEKS